MKFIEEATRHGIAYPLFLISMRLSSSLPLVLPLMRLPARTLPARTLCATMCDGGGERRSVSGVIYEAPADRPRVQLFTKEGCTLCDKAKEVLTTAASDQPHTLEAVDITDPENSDYWGRYKYDIPVLAIDGIYWAKHRCELPPYC